MQFNNHAYDQDIVSLVNDMTGLSKTAEINQITRACNEANRNIWSWIFEAFGGWQFDSTVNGDLPIATANLVANQSNYTLPSEALTVKAVEYYDGSVWHKLDSVPFDLINQHQSEKEFEDQPAEPRFYSLLGKVIKIRPASDTSRNNALRVQFNRGSTSFLPTAISQTPGFADEFHEAVAVGASFFIATNKNLIQRNALAERWVDFEKRIKAFYTKRWQEEFPPQIRVNDLVRENT